MRSRRNKGALLIAVVFMFSAVFTLNAKPVPGDKDNVYSVIEQRDDLSTFKQIVSTAKMDKPLQTEGPYTILAPSNSAFNKIDQPTVEKWKTDPTAAQKFLSSYIIEGNLSSEKIKTEKQVETINGEKVAISTNGDRVMAGGADVIAKDLNAKNGIVHVLSSCVNNSTVMGLKSEASTTK